MLLLCGLVFASYQIVQKPSDGRYYLTEETVI